MKKWGLVLVLALAATPAWCAKKVTVAELKDHTGHDAQATIRATLTWRTLLSNWS